MGGRLIALQPYRCQLACGSNLQNGLYLVRSKPRGQTETDETTIRRSWSRLLEALSL